MNDLKSKFSAVVIPLSLIVSVLVFIYILGNPQNFEGGDPVNHPLPGNYLGIVYKGGFIVPILLTLLLTVITFSLERFFTIGKAQGKASAEGFLKKIRTELASGNIDSANSECDRQKGSVANVIKSGLKKYKEMATEQNMGKDQKMLAIQKDIEEATSLELPSLEKNLPVLATIASISTLMGLLGTVLGMIRAFSALAQAGAPDSVALATGISEALINTALGIGTSAIAIIFYNFFTGKIDKLTYSIDEAGFSLVQTFASVHKN